MREPDSGERHGIFIRRGPAVRLVAPRNAWTGGAYGNDFAVHLTQGYGTKRVIAIVVVVAHQEILSRTKVDRRGAATLHDSQQKHD
jgi:hypothetical protein